MDLRTSELPDVVAITAIYREAVLTGTASFELEPPGLSEMQARRAALLEAGYPYLVMESDGSVAGYAYAAPYRARPAYRSTVENSVYVDMRFRGRGVARRLLDALVAETASRGYRQMIAVIGDSANLASIRLHEVAGFSHAGILRSVGWKHGRWLDTVLMQRELGRGDGAPSALAPHAASR
ncbi:GNAT family N-acetyltransferase [Enterovirga rhinocerotis]|uniref:Phosphinothricin acetyltransferase n=1 Tax=Enterovirga rhinocerotis TaxID=1339210 RepID=A0A4V3DXP7_9HYPH|nr:GNAT family N-acetyltransferase [Enterovirga rhinocerotis]TDR89319.1 phosphinothricin acetyltransferase [Enterovirga rhinocerotis]